MTRGQVLAGFVVALLGQSAVNLRDEGLLQGTTTKGFNCSGAGISCTVSDGKGTISVSGGGAGGAPTDATYITQTANAFLTNEQAMGALGNGIVINTTTTGVQSIYAGSACGANTVARSTSASGVLTCSAVDLASADVTGVLPAANGGSRTVEQSIVLSGGSGFFSATVTGQTWVAAGSEIICAPFGTTADGLTPEAITVGGLVVTASDRVVGTGFNINVFSPYGLTGTVRIHCIGA